MSTKRNDQYKGRLSPAQIAKGINAALHNAKRQADAAALLYANGYHALASAIAALSIEESGKVTHLRHLSLAKTDQEVVRVWKDYRTHTKKNQQWPIPMLFSQGATKLHELVSLLLDGRSQLPEYLDYLKQLGLYTDCLAEGNWSIPDEAVGEEPAKYLVGAAKCLSNSPDITVTDVELWAKHMGSAWKGRGELAQADLPALKRAVLDYYDAMHERGLGKHHSREASFVQQIDAAFKVMGCPEAESLKPEGGS